MAWHAKPSGAYSVGSSDWIDNLNEILSMLRGSWTDEAIAGMCGNLQAESGFNPWRWQSDSVSYSGGYGLPQFTPASGYIGLSGSTPNLSTTVITSGATPEDGARQIQAIDSDELGKWVGSCWRSYWSKITYSGLWTYAQEILNTWGNGSRVSMSDFKSCTDLDACTFMWLACYEGPARPNFTSRQSLARTIYENYMGGVVPPTPPEPPTPDPPSGQHLPAWLMKKMADNGKRKY